MQKTKNVSSGEQMRHLTEGEVCSVDLVIVRCFITIVSGL